MILCKGDILEETSIKHRMHYVGIHNELHIFLSSITTDYNIVLISKNVLSYYSIPVDFNKY